MAMGDADMDMGVAARADMGVAARAVRLVGFWARVMDMFLVMRQGAVYPPTLAFLNTGAGMLPLAVLVHPPVVVPFLVILAASSILGFLRHLCTVLPLMTFMAWKEPIGQGLAAPVALMHRV